MCMATYGLAISQLGVWSFHSWHWHWFWMALESVLVGTSHAIGTPQSPQGTNWPKGRVEGYIEQRKGGFGASNDVVVGEVHKRHAAKRSVTCTLQCDALWRNVGLAAPDVWRGSREVALSSGCGSRLISSPEITP